MHEYLLILYNEVGYFIFGCVWTNNYSFFLTFKEEGSMTSKYSRWKWLPYVCKENQLKRAMRCAMRWTLKLSCLNCWWNPVRWVWVRSCVIYSSDRYTHARVMFQDYVRTHCSTVFKRNFIWSNCAVSKLWSKSWPKTICFL